MFDGLFQVRFLFGKEYRDSMQWNPEPGLRRALFERLKRMAQLDLLEQPEPQYGRIWIKLPDRQTADFDIGVFPPPEGERVALRLLRSESDPALKKLPN